MSHTTGASTEPLAVSLTEAQAMLGGIGRNAVLVLIESGEIAAYKIGRAGRTSARRIPVASIRAYIARQIAEADATREALVS